MDYDPTQPWIRQPCDTDLTWHLFQAYLVLSPPRRMADLVRQARGLTLAQLQAVACNDMWEMRARAWDSHLDQIRISTVERVTAENAQARAQRQARAAKKLIALGERELDSLLAIAEQRGTTDGVLGLIAAKDIPRFIGIGVRTERLALGEATETISTGPDLSGMSVEDLRALREIQERASEGK